MEEEEKLTSNSKKQRQLRVPGLELKNVSQDLGQNRNNESGANTEKKEKGKKKVAAVASLRLKRYHLYRGRTVMISPAKGVGLNVITELIIGYLYPGRPLANVVFKTYGDNSMRQALQFLSDFKLGHYMKIPPKSMFIVQLVGTIIASTFYFATSWWLLTTIEFICDPANLPVGSPWTCPGNDVFYNVSIIWGLVGPQRMFGNLRLYSKMNHFFLFGILAPVPIWFLSRKYPEWKWVRLVNVPILINCPGPPAKAVNYNMWFTVGMFFNFVVYKRFKSWWARHNY